MSGHLFLISALVLYTQAANASLGAREAECTNDIEGCKAQSPSTDDNNLIQRSVKQFSVAQGLKPYDSSKIRTLLEALQTNLNEKKRAAGPLLKALKTNLKEKKHAAGVFLKALKSNVADMQLRKGAPCMDRDADVVAEAAKYGMNISGCADLAAYCSGDADSEMHLGGVPINRRCPETCGKCPGSAPPPCADKDAVVVEEAAKRGMTNITGCADIDFACSDDQVPEVCPVTCGNCPGSGTGPNGEQACENKNFTATQCASVGAGYCCQYDTEEHECHSAIGLAVCRTPCADKDAVVAEHAIIRGMTNITGCADIAFACSDDGMSEVCPVTCGYCPNTP